MGRSGTGPSLLSAHSVEPTVEPTVTCNGRRAGENNASREIYCDRVRKRETLYLLLRATPFLSDAACDVIGHRETVCAGRFCLVNVYSGLIDRRIESSSLICA